MVATGYMLSHANTEAVRKFAGLVLTSTELPEPV